MCTPCGSKWPLLRDTESPSAPASMPSRTTSCIALISSLGGGALLALVAHHVIAHRRVADQIADIDAEMAVEPVHVLRERLPIELDRVRAPPSGSLRHRRGTRRRRFALPGRTGASDSEQLPKTTVVAPWSGENEQSGSQVTCAS